MAAFSYYRAENARHRDVKALKITGAQAQAMSDALCEAKGLGSIPVQINSRARSWSWFCPNGGRPYIKLAPTMVDVLTVAHEWAHYARHEAHKGAKLKWAAETGKGPYFYPIRYRAHDARHAVMVDWAVVTLRERFPETFAKPAVAVTEVAPVPVLPPVVSPAELHQPPAKATPESVAKAMEAALQALPEQLTCPKCTATKHKTAFGVRVVKKDSYGNPVKIIRQSYCASCR